MTDKKKQNGKTQGKMTRRKALALGSAALWSTISMPRSAAQITRRKPNIIVFLADALRPDHMGCYGYTHDTSPRLDSFARQSILFERCYAPAPWTKPTIASLFTGVSPRVHQTSKTLFGEEVREGSVQILRSGFTTIAQILKQQGYHTAYFLSNSHVQKEYGFARGFDHYRYVFNESPQDQIRAVMTWIAQQPPEPFFIFIHEIDPHGPLIPPEQEFFRLFRLTPDQAKARLSREDQLVFQRFDFFNKGLATFEDDRSSSRNRFSPYRLSQRGVALLRQLYDGEIAGVDVEFGKLYHFLNLENYLDHTAIAFISDHGEAFKEHNLFFHGTSLYDEQTRVPCIIRPPSGCEGIRVPWTIGLQDLYATLALMGGVELGEEMGEPLLDPSYTPIAVGDRPVLSTLDYYTDETEEWDFSLVHGPWKLMTKENRKQRRLYNLENDPKEENDLAAGLSAPSEVLSRLNVLFNEMLAKDEKRAEKYGPPESARVGGKFIQELEALGYL